MTCPTADDFARHVDEALTRFAEERLHYSRDSFRSRFLSYLHLSHEGDDVQSFLLTAARIIRENMAVYSCFRNPFNQAEPAFLLVTLFVIILGIFFLEDKSQPYLGLALIVGALLQALVVVKKIWNDCSESDLQFHIYGELKQIVDTELSGYEGTGDGSPPATQSDQSPTG